MKNLAVASLTMRKVLTTYNSYVAFLIANCKLTHKEVITKIADYTADENFSIKDIEYLSNLWISNIRNETKNSSVIIDSQEKFIVRSLNIA